MDRKELVAALKEVKLEQVITVNGQPFPVEEIVPYKEGRYKWLDLVRYDENELEIALEIEGDKLSLWLEVDDIKEVVTDAINYRGEAYALDEEDQGTAETVCRYIKDGEEIKGVALTPYAVFNAPSGRRLCREIWEGKDKWYFAGPETPEVSI